MANALFNSILFITHQIQLNLTTLAWITMILWAVFFLNKALGGVLLLLGIVPRKIYGLPGIVCSPFLHANFNHLFFNTVPLLVLSAFILVNGLPYFLLATASITLLSGTLIWLFAKSGRHVGASGVITGYWGLLIVDIYQEGSATAILLGIVSLYYFAGIFFGIFPGKKGVSWEGHLFGLLAGIATSFLLN
ncbi:MAG: rhomboid family intramembrane serine protease [Gammaproteobacteria bacterium]|nr:rhomboid family intramembrane serine protease [Gammaproteobacteria bacterium]